MYTVHVWAIYIYNYCLYRKHKRLPIAFRSKQKRGVTHHGLSAFLKGPATRILKDQIITDGWSLFLLLP